MSPQADYIWKIVVGGQGGVGKTTFITRYMTGQFIADTALTVGVEFHNHIMELDGKKINLVLWDLGGEDRFRFLQSNLIRGAVAALVFFDMSRLMTLIQIKDWVSIIRENTLPHIPILLIGGKVDLVDEERQKIVVKDAYGLAKELNLTGYIATSSKSGQNVQESMHKLVSILLEQLKR